MAHHNDRWILSSKYGYAARSRSAWNCSIPFVPVSGLTNFYDRVVTLKIFKSEPQSCQFRSAGVD
jgi:hypothetical protein